MDKSDTYVCSREGCYKTVSLEDIKRRFGLFSAIYEKRLCSAQCRTKQLFPNRKEQKTWTPD